MTIEEVPIWQLAVGCIAFSILMSLYATCFQGDLIGSFTTRDGILRYLKRATVGLLVALPLCFGVPTWATVYYPFTNLHAYGFLSFGLTFISGNDFNRAIGMDTDADTSCEGVV